MRDGRRALTLMRLSLRTLVVGSAILAALVGLTFRAYRYYYHDALISGELSAMVTAAGGGTTWREPTSAIDAFLNPRHINGIYFLEGDLSEKELDALSTLLKDCRQLEYLTMESEHVTDTHVKRILYNNSLVDLRLPNAHLSDACAPDVTSQARLKTLDVRGTQVTGSVVGAICTSCQLESLFLSCGDNDVFEAIGACPTLTTVVIENTEATPRAMRRMAGRASLLELELVRVTNAMAALEGAHDIPIHRLHLEDCGQIDGRRLADLSHLRTLSLFDCAVNAVDLQELAKSQSLEVVQMVNIDGEIDFTVFSQAPRLTMIYCDGCQIVPDSVALLRSADPTMHIVIK